MWTTGPGCALEDLTETNRHRGEVVGGGLVVRPPILPWFTPFPESLMSRFVSVTDRDGTQ